MLIVEYDGYLWESYIDDDGDIVCVRKIYKL